jgi:hypothetical protein
MRGPIDFIIVGFEGNTFDGSILRALTKALDQGIIRLVAFVLVSKDGQGWVTTTRVDAVNDTLSMEFAKKYIPDEESVDKDDVKEVADVLENNTAAGLLVVEHTWAIPLKKAIIDAKGVLVADGRIHPDAAYELTA